MGELKELIDNYKIEKIFDYINNDLSKLNKLKKILVIIYFFDKNCYKKYTNGTDTYLNFSKLNIESFHNKLGQILITKKLFDFNGIIFKDNDDKIKISCLKNGLLKIKFNCISSGKILDNSGLKSNNDKIDKIINLYNSKAIKSTEINFSYNIVGLQKDATKYKTNEHEKSFNCSSIQENRFDLRLGVNPRNSVHDEQFNDYLIDELNNIIENLKNYTNS